MTGDNIAAMSGPFEFKGSLCRWLCADGRDDAGGTGCVIDPPRTRSLRNRGPTAKSSAPRSNGLIGSHADDSRALRLLALCVAYLTPRRSTHRDESPRTYDNPEATSGSEDPKVYAGKFALRLRWLFARCHGGLSIALKAPRAGEWQE